MDANKLKDILDKHMKWLRNEQGGERADLQDADLQGADLKDAYLQRAYLQDADLLGAYLRGADLQGADLRGADLQGADLKDAYLQDADLQGAYLQRAYLQGADLQGADLRGADLQGANLQDAYLQRAYLQDADLLGADLQGAYLRGAYLKDAKIGMALINMFFPICCPEYGTFIAWKKASNHIVKLQIPEDAKRSSAFGRKCRASKAVCLEIQNNDGTDSGMTEISSDYDRDFIYHVGETVEVANFDDDRTHECASGIHFFITRQEAVDY